MSATTDHPTPDAAARFPATPRTTIGRLPERGSRRRDDAYAILDEGLVCHVGLATADGPVVIPTSYARRDDELLVHGSPAATWLRSTSKGTPVCVTVTHLDGLVLARSGFHHSMNYRSVVVFGVAERIDDEADKARALDAIVEHLVPGRTAEIRPATPEEVRQTLVVRVPLAEASVKVRAGGPNDDDADHAGDAWAGVVPVTTTFGAPIDDPLLRPGISVAASAAGYTRPG